MIKDVNNGSTLAELKFKPNENLNVASRGSHSWSKAPLLNDEKTDLNERAIFIFTNLFKEYSVPDPEKENKLFIGREECAKFVTGVTAENCTVIDARVQSIISKYD